MNNEPRRPETWITRTRFDAGATQREISSHAMSAGHNRRRGKQWSPRLICMRTRRESPNSPPRVRLPAHANERVEPRRLLQRRKMDAGSPDVNIHTRDAVSFFADSLVFHWSLLLFPRQRIVVEFERECETNRQIWIREIIYSRA